MKKNLLTLLLLLIAYSVSAQHKCGFDHTHEHQIENNQAYRQAISLMDKEWADYIENKMQYGARPVIEGTDTIYEIPVVVHVFHNGEAVGHNYNKSAADIEAWLDYTNAIFAGTAPGYVSTGTGGTVIPVRLVLAQRDPDCNPTDGIVRVNGSSIPGYTANGLRSGSSSPGVDESELKPLSRWDESKYYNIYIVHKIDGWDGYVSGSGVAGYAGFPTNSDYNYSTFLFSATVETDNNTMAHEFGHSMGLYHTFQGSNPPTTICPATETDCASQGDRVCDTEIHELIFSCPSSSTINSCTGLPYAGAQYNVMAYGSCPNRFTPGQRDRAMFMLKTYRLGLLHSIGSLPPPDLSEVITLASASGCMPTSTGTAAYAIGPTMVSFGDIFVVNGGASDDGAFYIDHTTASCPSAVSHTIVNAESVVDLSFSIKTTNSQYVRAYIDYNNNGIFEPATEEVYNSGTGLAAPNTYTVPITIPGTGVVRSAPLRMRVIADFDVITGPCSNRAYGQTEDFAITVDNPLFQNIIAFNATVNQCNASVNWSVDDVKEVVYFDIQKSVDGSQFCSIEKVKPVENQKNYTISESLKSNGTLVYRMAVHTQDGKVHYSKVAKIAANCNLGFEVFPNPTNGLTTVKYYANGKMNVTIHIIDVTGKIVMIQNVQADNGVNQWNVDMQSLVAGAYVIKVVAEQNVQQQVLIKK